ncbi:uncharacterized protein LOC125532595 [Triticum urartu]|uniref:uncharacterized protein LOC125532595 n=1 Tax=Triticum urartu TaxID=4572 RepID=UPI00204452E0|nr:uncharacterized protein LOC125532595 [Triticum urartu]
MASVEQLESEEEVERFEPFFYDSEDWDAWAEEEVERRRREEEEKARRMEENRRRREAHDAVMDSIIQHDPKVGRDVYTRFFLRDFSVFDINEESSVPPMRYTDSIYQDEFGLEDSANILSVSIVSSDVGFPVNVYGRVIARDSIDYKCIYLFHRNRDDCQHLNKDGMLILTGPYRGLVLVDFIYLEIDLKIREEGVPDRPFSKGLISIDGRVLSREKDVMVRSETLESWLSTTEVRFTTVLNAVECTFEIKLIEGLFKGNITVGIADKARKLDNEQTIVIHDSTADGVVTSDETSQAPHNGP